MKKTIILLFLVLSTICNSQETEENIDHSILCQKMYDSTKFTDDPTKKLLDAIIEVMGKGEDISDRKAFISNFVNTNIIICNKNSLFLIRDNEPFLKRSVSSGNTHFIREIGDEDGYNINFNAIEIVDGIEETLLDYLYKIIESPNLRTRYDNDGIEDLIDIVEENGGKRAKDL